MKKNLPAIAFFLCCYLAYAPESAAQDMVLGSGWSMQSALKLNATGKEISQTAFKEQDWNSISVPTTVIAGLLRNKRFDFDPFYGNNLQKIAGPEFDTSWWFRKKFLLPQTAKGKNVTLILHGINYKANIWLNGERIADTMTIMGPFRIFELDISKQVKYTGTNVLAIEIRRPVDPNKRGGDLAVDYADWIHYPADFNAGIINDIALSFCDKVAIRHPLVTTHFDLPSLAVAHLDVDAEVYNYASSEEDVVVQGNINGSIRFQQKLHMMPGELKSVVFNSADYPMLNLKNPAVWWPWQYGKPRLNKLELKVMRKGKLSSSLKDEFGIREMSSELIDTKSRKFIINGKPILLRGAAWSPDIFQRRSPQRQEQEIRLVRDMNMNLIRSEGKLEDDHFYDLCDRYGMLVMSGWMCCGAWQYPEKWDSAKRTVAMESGRSVMYWLRNKACLMVWLNGSDMPPRDTTVEKGFLQIEKDLKWPNPILATADGSVSKVSGYSGVKMNGPYDWVPPIYWETDSNKHGGAWSFATEISPGPSIPPYESLVKFIPQDSLAINSSDWLYHCGTMQFGNTNIFNEALHGRYGPSGSIREFVSKAQVQNYEGHRAMMEAFGLNKYHTATGVVQWMLSNPWPSLIWHTYDYYLYPAGTYFGMKKSMEPLHIQYSYYSGKVSIINSLLKPFTDFQASAQVFDMQGKPGFFRMMKTGVGADTIQECFAVPEPANADPVYFLRLELKDNMGKPVSINWYWLSKKDDSLNWAKSKWYYTPQSAYADFSALKDLAPTTLKLSLNATRLAETTNQKITITNTGKSVAFFVHLRLLNKKGGADILPVIFEDNYICLAPGETRKISCSYLIKDAPNALPYLEVSGSNLDPVHSVISRNAGMVRDSWSR